MKNDLVSVLMPVRNAGNYLRECLESVIAQDLANWELIAVDDHSEDNSLEILRRSAGEEPRIRVLQNNGTGIVPALRQAFLASAGNYISRMDADDVMAKNKLSRLKDLLQNRGEGHVATALVKVFPATTVQGGYRRYEEWLNGLTLSRKNYTEIYKECVIPSPCWMVNRNDLQQCGAFEAEVYPEDYDLCFRFYRQGLKVVSSPEVLHFWRDHPERASRNDPHYTDQTFFSLKLDHFFEADRLSSRQLVLWGAGRKGKQLARELIGRGKTFSWVCNNEKKAGNEIYGQVVMNDKTIMAKDDLQILVAVSGPEDQRMIGDYFLKRGWVHNKDFYFFC